MRLATDEFIDWLYEGCQRKHCYRVTFTFSRKSGGMSYCSQAIVADYLREAITFAQRIIEFRYPDEDLSDMVLEKAFKLPDNYGSTY